ncbi:putative membrane protein [Anoxybacillus sp. B7M1]|uniref:DUF3955 domain-containing protein n=1 Tax=Anoxybacteroides rupiense TaxID=311460 RepID=A0ABD5IX60_9BACL|nr:MULTISPECIES: hypothetical protein [Anoxybacillus]ANB57311.1 putative membrane protein [Anoxybacillus sp. B2M1]ANB65553.1 putative membrane protein [Anoxybacillus sp. B7M1]KXG09732.1 hypothetical protein AT864_01900 [Anoxybacillus sp. P3H1B]MBB3908505.1 Zn-dependent protease with chaperone function [Anoxybacillus rupiensis]MBS2770877.1 hypothetical protein [Anoxybacillus rupiensis]
MAKYISIFFLVVGASFILFMLFGSLLDNGGDPAEGAVYIFGTIIVLLLSFIIAQMFYLLHVIRRKR